MGISWNDMRMFLGPEVNAAISVAEGEDPMAAMGNYAIGQGINYGVNSGADALHGATESVDAATNNVNPALETTPPVDAPTVQNEMVGPMQPPPPVNQAFPNDTSLSNSANINIGDNATVSYTHLTLPTILRV